MIEAGDLCILIDAGRVTGDLPLFRRGSDAVSSSSRKTSLNRPDLQPVYGFLMRVRGAARGGTRIFCSYFTPTGVTAGS